MHEVHVDLRMKEKESNASLIGHVSTCYSNPTRSKDRVTFVCIRMRRTTAWPELLTRAEKPRGERVACNSTLYQYQCSMLCV